MTTAIPKITLRLTCKIGASGSPTGSANQKRTSSKSAVTRDAQRCGSQNVLTHPTSTLDCVDLFTGRGLEPRFDHNIHRSGRSSQVRKHKGRSDVILPELPEAYFDVIYIDGSHRAADVLLDAALSWRLLKCDGLMIFDDYLWEMDKPLAQRPQIAIDLFLEAYVPRLRVVHHGYQVAVQRTR